MGTPLGPKYIPSTYLHGPFGYSSVLGIRPWVEGLGRLYKKERTINTMPSTVNSQTLNPKT